MMHNTQAQNSHGTSRSPTTRTEGMKRGAIQYPGSMDEIPVMPLRRRKTQVACSECRRRQVKCEQLPPGSPCTRCKDRKIKCEYLPNHNRASPTTVSPVDEVHPSQLNYRHADGGSHHVPAMSVMYPSQPHSATHPHWDSSTWYGEAGSLPPQQTSQYTPTVYAEDVGRTPTYNYVDHNNSHPPNSYDSANHYYHEHLQRTNHVGNVYAVDQTSISVPGYHTSMPAEIESAYRHPAPPLGGQQFTGERGINQLRSYPSLPEICPRESGSHFDQHQRSYYRPQMSSNPVDGAALETDADYYDHLGDQWMN